jgi:hypothetical protein
MQIKTRTLWRTAAVLLTLGLPLAAISETTRVPSHSGGMFTGLSPVESFTITNTATLQDGLKTYTNTGDEIGNATITLADNPDAGLAWRFAVTAGGGHALVIVPPSGETLYLGTDQCTASISSSTVGATLEIRAVIGGNSGMYASFGNIGGWSCNDA